MLQIRGSNDKLAGSVAGSPLDRFWKYVAESDGCWEWTGTKDKAGYGQIKLVVGDKKYLTSKATHFSYEIHHGPIPKGLFVLHKCDNPGCVRPDHLEAGTQSKNIKDCFARGRANKRGENSGTAKLTNEQAAAARAEYSGARGEVIRLAKKYGISQPSMSELLNGRSYA